MYPDRTLKIRLFPFVVLLVAVPGVSDSRARDQFHLPEGALARLGNGTVASHSRSVVYSPDGTRLTVASSVGIWLFDTDTGDEVALLQGHEDWFWGDSGVSFSPDGRTLATGGRPNQVWLYDVDSGQVTATLEGHTRSVRAVSFSPDGRILASGGWDDMVRLWDVDSGRETATLEAIRNRSKWCRFHRMAESWPVAVMTGRCGCGTWAAARKPPPWTIGLGSHWCRFHRMAEFWPVAVTTIRYGCGMWTAARKPPPWKSTRSVRCRFHPMAESWPIGGYNNPVRLWDVDSGQETATLQGRLLSFSLDGRTLATAGGHTVRLWDVDSGRETATLQGHTSAIQSIMFSPDDRTLASGGYSTVRLWDVDSGRETATLGHEGWVPWVSFSPDGRFLASGNEPDFGGNYIHT